MADAASNPPATQPNQPGAPSGLRSRPVGLAVAVLGLVLAMGGSILAINALNARRSDQQSAVQTPTRDAFLARAAEAMRNSSWPEAEAVLREAIGIYERDQELRLQLADVLRTRATAAGWQREAGGMEGVALSPAEEAARAEADAAARQRDSIDAYQQVLVALEIGPATPEVEFRAGLLASESDQPGKAIEHFQAARASAPDNAEYALYLAQAQLAERQTGAAKASLMACVNLDPDNAIAWGTLADIALQENKPDIAIQHAEHARSIQPDVTLWRLVQARALKRRGDAEEALQLLIALPGPEQHDPPVLSLIAECYAYLGRPGDAADRYGTASDARPADPALALEAARWFQRAQNAERALVYAERAAMLGDAEAAGLVDELRGG